MKSKRHLLTVAFVSAAILWAGCVVQAQSGETFKVRLSPVPIDAAMMSRIAGSGSATATLTGKKLTISGNFSGLRSAATDAHIHRGAKGIRGPSILDLTVSKGTSGSVSGSLDLTAEQIEDLRNNRFYIQINSERAPDGNLWGWLLR
jgi:CHRD domain